MVRAIRNKKGEETGMSMPKLVAIILTLIVVILLIVGISSGSLNPMINSLKETWNYVLSFFAKPNSGGQGSGGVQDIPCNVLGKDRTCQVNYDDNWCKVNLGDRQGETADITLNGNEYSLRGVYLMRGNGELLNADGNVVQSGYVNSEDEIMKKIEDTKLYNAWMDSKKRFKLTVDGKEYTLDNKGLVYDKSCGIKVDDYSISSYLCFWQDSSGVYLKYMDTLNVRYETITDQTFSQKDDSFKNSKIGNLYSSIKELFDNYFYVSIDGEEQELELSSTLSSTINSGDEFLKVKSVDDESLEFEYSSMPTLKRDGRIVSHEFGITDFDLYEANQKIILRLKADLRRDCKI